MSITPQRKKLGSEIRQPTTQVQNLMTKNCISYKKYKKERYDKEKNILR